MMIPILTETLQIILILFFMGAGFTAIFLPKILKEDSFWLIPWFGIIVIAVLGVVFNLGKVPLSQSKDIVLAIGGALMIYAVLSKKKIFHLNKEVLFLAILVLVSLIYNLFPLMARVGYPTTISLGNLDPMSYTPVADFLKNHSLFEGKLFEHYKPYLWATGDLLHGGFRWGSPMVLSFIASVLGVRAYAVYFILLVLSFVLSFPLVYILAKRMITKGGGLLMLLIFFTFAFNSTMLYMVYNVFFAQFLFSGIYIVLFLLIYEYFKSTDASLRFNFFDLLIALSISSITTIYPEGLAFALVPLIIAVALHTLRNKNVSYAVQFLKICALAFVINPYTFGTAVEQNIKIIASSTRSVFIGWENIPYAAPLEIMGFYNLYYSRNLSGFIDVVLGIPIVFIWFMGFKKLKYPLVMLSYVFTFLPLYIGLRYIFPNFFTYHRVVTYSLFLYPVLFGAGILYFFEFLHKNLKYVCIGIFIILSLRSAYRTTYQMYWHMRVVDKALISLEELNSAKNIPQPFYTADVFLGEYDLWKRLWREYFLMDNLIITRQNFPTEIPSLPEEYTVLAEKDRVEYQGKKLQFKTIVWENEYYKLGEIEKIPYADDLEKLIKK